MKNISFAAAASLFSLAAVAVSPAAGAVALKDGVYSADQAKRGMGAVGETCARCHALTLLGGENNSPPLTGDAFQAKWKDKSLGDLYQKMFATMPKDSPGSLDPDDYIDILAYVLSVNKYPAGKSDLKPDITALKAITIEPPK